MSVIPDQSCGIDSGRTSSHTYPNNCSGTALGSMAYLDTYIGNATIDCNVENAPRPRFQPNLSPGYISLPLNNPIQFRFMVEMPPDLNFKKQSPPHLLIQSKMSQDHPVPFRSVMEMPPDLNFKISAKASNFTQIHGGNAPGPWSSNRAPLAGGSRAPSRVGAAAPTTKVSR